MLRHGSATAKQKVIDEFKIGTLLNLAATVNAAEAAVLKELYERTIDSGAHPNELALMQTLQINKSHDRIEFKCNYLDNDSLPFRLALKTVAQVGVCTLSLFRTIYSERFDILGVTGLLSHVKCGL